MGALDIFEFYGIEVKKIQLPTRLQQTKLDRNDDTNNN
jgi:hypothetical protein